jgi:hypothetical protein
VSLLAGWFSALGPVRAVMLFLAGSLVLFGAWLVIREQLEARRRRPRREPPQPAARTATGHPRCAGPGIPPPEPGSRCAEVLALFGDLQPGDALSRWTLGWLGQEWNGAVRVGLLDSSGNPFELEVRRRDSSGPPSPAVAGDLALYLVGVASGSVTPEEQGLGAMTLASYLEGVAAPLPEWLQPLPSPSAPR